MFLFMSIPFHITDAWQQYGISPKILLNDLLIHNLLLPSIPICQKLGLLFLLSSLIIYQKLLLLREINFKILESSSNQSPNGTMICQLYPQKTFQNMSPTLHSHCMLQQHLFTFPVANDLQIDLGNIFYLQSFLI